MQTPGCTSPDSSPTGDPEALARLVGVNVNGVLRCIHAVLPHMITQRSGDILVTSSISGHTDIHWEPVYSASKHAIQGLVHTLRRQVASQGIRVGAVAPGMVADELWGITTREEVDRRSSRSARRCAARMWWRLLCSCSAGPLTLPSGISSCFPRARIRETRGHHVKGYTFVFVGSPSFWLASADC